MSTPQAFGRTHEESELICPRCHGSMAVKVVGEAEVDICPNCEAIFFDVGELFAALGTTSDPSYWDRNESSSAVKDAGIVCPRCKGGFVLQVIERDGKKVEIDRCNKCSGLFLDKGEAEQLKAIGAAAMDDIASERRTAEAALAKMGDPDFSDGFLNKFLGLVSMVGKKKK